MGLWNCEGKGGALVVFKGRELDSDLILNG